MSQGVNQGKEPGLCGAVCCALEAQLEGTLCWAVSCRTRQAQLSAVWDSILKVWWPCMVCMAVVAVGCGNTASAGGAQQVRTALQVRWVVRGKGASGHTRCIMGEGSVGCCVQCGMGRAFRVPPDAHCSVWRAAVILDTCP